MGRTVKEKKQTVAEIREQICKFEAMVATQPLNQVYCQTLESLRRRHIDRMNEGELELQMKYGADWWESVKLMYPMIRNEDGTITVISEAANWNEEKSFGPYTHKYDAMEKIEKLVFYKNQDRKRGVGCRDKDMERVAPMQLLQTAAMGEAVRTPRGRQVPKIAQVKVGGASSKHIARVKAKLNAETDMKTARETPLDVQNAL